MDEGSVDEDERIVASYEDVCKLKHVLFVIDSTVGTRIGETHGMKTVSVEPCSPFNFCCCTRSQTM